MDGMASELPVCFGGFSERMNAAVRSDGIFFTFFFFKSFQTDRLLSGYTIDRLGFFLRFL
jgi:hypothetical protein